MYEILKKNLGLKREVFASPWNVTGVFEEYGSRFPIDTHFGAIGSAWDLDWDIPSVVNPMYTAEEMNKTVDKAAADAKTYKSWMVLTLPEWEGEEYLTKLRQMEGNHTAVRLWRFGKGEYSFVAAKTALAKKEQEGAARWPVCLWVVGVVQAEKVANTKREIREWAEANTKGMGSVASWATMEDVECDVCKGRHESVRSRAGWWCPQKEVWVPVRGWMDMTGIRSGDKVESVWIGGVGEEEVVEIYTDAGNEGIENGFVWAYWIPKWDLQGTGHALWCTDIGQAETLAVLRGIERVHRKQAPRRGGVLIEAITDSRAAVAAIMGRNLGHIGGKLEGKLAARIRGKLRSEDGLILIWSKAHTKDEEIAEVEQAKRIWYGGAERIEGHRDEGKSELAGVFLQSPHHLYVFHSSVRPLPH
jgi:hypothetical protein